MSRFFRISALFALAACCVACAATLPVHPYAPQNVERVAGRVDLGSFAYTPYTQGLVATPNQIQNTAPINIILSTEVADFVKRGTALELRASGVTLATDAPIILEGEILEFKADDAGNSVIWSYKIKFTIVDRAESRVIFQRTYAPEPEHTGKLDTSRDYSTIMGENVLAAYDMFIRDPEVKKIFAETMVPDPRQDNPGL